ncbi:MAG TPA: UbiA family prenyltransferase [Candidatus Polarisedimenticolia bacterium]|nr:UbiA family prenyltransferase [Candidatus Polarisedimenticolia bacterium]
MRDGEEPRTIGLARRGRLYFAFARPFTLLPPTLGVVSGALTAFGSAHNPDPARRFTLTIALVILLGSLCAAFLNAASNVINQVHDLEIDRRNKPHRPLPSGAISRTASLRFATVLYLLAVVPTWAVVIHPRTAWVDKITAPPAAHECFYIYLAGLILTFIYSDPAWGRTKRFGFWANLTIALPRGCLLKVAGWSMVGSVLHLEPWYIGAIFMLFLLGATSSKDFSDMDGDAAHGCRTLPIRLGVRRAARLIAPFFVLPWLLIPLGTILPDPIEGGTLLTGDPVLLTVLGLALAVWGGYTAWLIVRDPASLAASENHPSWTHMYLMMMFAQVGFALAYLF